MGEGRPAEVPVRIGIEGDARAHFLYHDGSSFCERTAGELRILTRGRVEREDPVVIVCGACAIALADLARATAPPGKP